jgi:hypothetical protein
MAMLTWFHNSHEETPYHCLDTQTSHAHSSSAPVVYMYTEEGRITAMNSTPQIRSPHANFTRINGVLGNREGVCDAVPLNQTQRR